MSSRRESEFARLEQLLREADKRIEQKRRRTGEADERAKQERRRAEEEQRNQIEADERAELERQRADKEQRTRQQAEVKTRPTTFEEYIRAYHTLLSKPLQIQTDRSLSTQGSITNPKNKPCLTLLRPWTDFPTL